MVAVAKFDSIVPGDAAAAEALNVNFSRGTKRLRQLLMQLFSDLDSCPIQRVGANVRFLLLAAGLAGLYPFDKRV